MERGQHEVLIGSECKRNDRERTVNRVVQSVSPGSFELVNWRK